MRVQLDVAGREAIVEDPERVFAGNALLQHTQPLAEIVSPLIIEADGAVVPVEYSFGRELALGNLRDASLTALAARWKTEKQSSFRRLCREVHAAATASNQPAVINWYGLIAQKAEAETAPIHVHASDNASGTRGSNNRSWSLVVVEQTSRRPRCCSLIAFPSSQRSRVLVQAAPTKPSSHAAASTVAEISHKRVAQALAISSIDSLAGITGLGNST